MRIIDYYNFTALLINIILTGIAVYLFLRNHKTWILENVTMKLLRKLIENR